MFDWSLAQEAWSDEQKNVWADIEKMWRNFEITTWNVIQGSQEWISFADDVIKNSFTNQLQDDNQRVKAWRLINLLMRMYPEFDVYTYQDGTIIFGIKPLNGNGRIFFGLIHQNNCQYRYFDITKRITNTTYFDRIDLVDDDIEELVQKFAQYLNKQNDNFSYQERLQNDINNNPITNRQRYLPRDYQENVMTIQKITTWAQINLDLAGRDTWDKIKESETWKNGFAGTVADVVFKQMAEKNNIETCLRVWTMMCEVASKYHLDIYSHNYKNEKDLRITVGRKEPTDPKASTTPFIITTTLFQKGQDNPDKIDFDKVPDSTALDDWLKNPNPKYPLNLENIKQRENNAIYLPSDFAKLPAQEQDKENITPTTTPPRAIPPFALNVIFYGPPGTGKTYTTTERAVRICNTDTSKNIDREELTTLYKALIDEGKIVFTTFHQSYSYEDFMEGIKATAENGQISYEPKDGVFKELCEKAKNTPNDNFVLVIDEINRGNISRIFGELITLIEASKRAGNPEELSVTLPYTKERFSVPQNVYIIGTMNTADRSLAGLDLALRRRFHFEEMMPNTDILNGLKVDNIDIQKLLTVINQRIEVLLDREHTIGHAYFMKLKEDGKATIATLSDIFLNQIIPLLQEYFFEDWEKINMVLGKNGFVEPKESANNLFIGQNKPPQKKIWKINKEAFKDAEKYKRIYTDNMPNPEE